MDAKANPVPLMTNRRKLSLRSFSQDADDFGSQMPLSGSQSVFFGFVPYEIPHGSEFTGFKREDAALDKALSECNRIRQTDEFKEGVLLRCIENKPMFSFLHYAVSKEQINGRRVNSLLNELDVSQNSYTAAYDEIFTIQKQTTEPALPSNRHAGFIVICFKILDQTFKQNALEKSWLSWTGAREIYKHSPRPWNLKRISLHRHSALSSAKDAFAYVLLCEFSNILHPGNALHALDMCERLRARNCGHIALYQVQYNYESLSLAPERPLSHAKENAWTSPSVSPRNRIVSGPKPIAPLQSPSHRRRTRNLASMGYSQDVDTAHAMSNRRNALLRLRDRSLGYDLDGSHQFHSYHQLEEVT
jgi:hypothetical protein